jgi:tRNA A37 N6-isopentenylltransferase MiaA
MTLDRFSLEKIYMSFIRPILEYPDVIWDSQNQSLINKLENVQLNAAKVVTGGTKLTGLNRLYEETKWEKISDRRQNHKLIVFHKIKNNRTPQYLLDLIPNSVDSRHNHNTRQVNNMLEINTRTNQYADYFLPSTIKFWNNLSLTLRKTESLSIFKKKPSKIKMPKFLLTTT